MWLAKLYVNALLAVWLSRKAEGEVPGKLPTIACAAKATYLDQDRKEQALYYMAGPASSTMLHDRLGLRSAAIVARHFDWLVQTVQVFAGPPPRRPEAISDDRRIVFCDQVIDRDPSTIAGELFPLPATDPQAPAFWDPESGQMAKMRKRALGFCYPNNPCRDADGGGGYGLLVCAEQRVLLCHRWVKQHPDAAALPSGIELELEQMTVAMADYDYYRFPSSDHREDLGTWWNTWDRGAWWTDGTGFPMHPCNTCRVALPALLCDGGSADPLPSPTDVIPGPP